jgi:hypothetical protein
MHGKPAHSVIDVASNSFMASQANVRTPAIAIAAMAIVLENLNFLNYLPECH